MTMILPSTGDEPKHDTLIEDAVGNVEDRPCGIGAQGKILNSAGWGELLEEAAEGTPGCV